MKTSRDALPPNLCKDCASYGGKDRYLEVCNDARNQRWNYITGETIVSDAVWLRDSSRDDACGPEGKWWIAVAS